MGRILAALCALALLWAGPVCPALAADETAPSLPEGRSQYDMDVTLDTAGDRLAERVTVTFANDSDTPWPTVCFNDYVPAVQEGVQAGAYTSAVTGVTDGDGAPLDYVYDRPGGLLTVTLPQPLEPGGTAAVTIGYEADVPHANQMRFQAASFPDSDGITYRLCQFFPVLCVWRDGGFVSHPYAFGGEAFFSACADYVLTLRLPEAFTVIASGQETRLGSEDGLAVWRIEAGNMRDLVVTATTEFAPPYTGQAGNVTVRSWGTPGQADQAETSLQAALDSVELFGRLFGDYPYGELDICVAYMPEVAGGIEYPGLVEIIQAQLTAPGFLGIIVAHEVAHQWFYAVVGNDQYDEPFLDESFASFCETLYRQYVLGDSLEDIAGEVNTWDLISGGALRIDRSYGDYYAGDEDAGSLSYYMAIYELGRTFLWQVRQAMGDEAFFAMMRSWYAQERFQIATIDGFLEHLTACSGGDPAVAALVGKYMAR